MAKIKEFQSAEQQTVVVKALRYSYICEMHKRWLSWAESKWLPPWNVADEKLNALKAFFNDTQGVQGGRESEKNI